MRRVRSILPSVFAFGVLVAACNGTTGDQLISFTPYASGVAAATKPFTAYFRNSSDVNIPYTIQLTSAVMTIGAVYFDESPPSTSFDAPVCNVSDVYAAQVPGGVTVNLMSTAPQEFTVYGSGSADLAESWDIWLTQGDINQPTSTPTVTLTGVATLASDPTPANTFSFGAVVTINPSLSGGGARGMAASDPALPGQYPICKERILQIGGLNLQFYQGGTLLMTVDPRGWFTETASIDFSQLALASDQVCEPTEDDWLDAYESFGPCDSNNACPTGQMCNLYTANGNPSCVVACPNGSTDCAPGYSCNPADNYCITTYCIPDTNYAELCTGTEVPATNPCTSEGASEAGEAFFLGVTNGASAYAVSYTRSSSSD